jgi:hypothetical protein
MLNIYNAHQYVKYSEFQVILKKFICVALPANSLSAHQLSTQFL